MSADLAKDPLVSVVVAVRNGAATLPRCIDSVLSQGDVPVDLVIIDGGSTDGTVECIKRYSDGIGYWVSEPDDGVYSAWNKAVSHIRGDWVCFLGSDDRLADPDALSRMAPDLQQRPERVVYGVTHVLDDAGNMRSTMGEPWPETRAGLSSQMSLPNPSTFYHRELFEVHGRFDERFKIAGDYEFLLRELAGGDAYFVDTLVTIMGWGGLSQDPRNWPRSLREAARARRMNGLPATPDWRSFQLYEVYAYASLTRWLGNARADRAWARYHGLRRRLHRLASRLRR